MSGDFPFVTKIVSPSKCNDKPWDLWVSEIGHSSPRPDDDGLLFMTPVDAKGGASRRQSETHPYKMPTRTRYRRTGISRLKQESMSLHGLFPQLDNLNAAVCHMCGVVVKCSAAYRHLLESHSSNEQILPPPPPAPSLKPKPGHSKSRHKKETISIPTTIDIHPVKMETSPAHNTTTPLSRIVLPDLQYLEEAGPSAGLTGEVQVCVESGELPVVSIQDTDLPLGENITDDILAIMDSEGIQSADDITSAADWKNIIKDINMQDITFHTPDSMQQDLYTPVDTSRLPAYTLSDTADLSNAHFAAPSSSPLVPAAVMTDTNVLNAQTLKPVSAATTATTPTSKSQSRSKNSKSKFNSREYDPNKHCGVVTSENLKPCTRSLTCKAHALSLRRNVEGRSKPFDTLLAEHRAAREANAAASAAPAVLNHTSIPTQPPVATTVPVIPPLLVNTPLDAFNSLTAEQQVNDIYNTLLSVEDPNAILPDTATINSLLNQPLPADFLLPDDAEIPVDVPILSIASPEEQIPPVILEEKLDEGPPPLVPTDVCWYSSCPRPLALCTFNASHAGGAITLGKKFATVRSNLKSSLSRSQKTTGVTNNYYYNQNALSLSKTVHINNSSKTNKPEVRKLIVTCSATSGNSANKEIQQTLSDLFGGDVRHALNGHIGHMEHKPRSSTLKHTKQQPSTVLDLGFSLDPLLADAVEKC